MPSCKRILCVIDPDRHGEQLLRQAVQHAERCGARLLTAHVVDHHTGYESDHIPFVTPAELSTALAKAAQQRIRAMLDRLYPQGNLWVEVGAARRTVVELATACEADLVIVASHSPFGLHTSQALTPPHRWPFEVVTLQVRRHWNPLNLLRTGREPCVLEESGSLIT